MSKCNLCNHLCNIDRDISFGYCKAPNKLFIAKAYLHEWEEPVITGKRGSGTIFFSYCNLRCVYCQNYEISINHVGKEVSIDRFSDICLELQNKGATNINLVTPTHFVPLIVEGLKLAKSKGLNIPIVYNTSSYETVDTIKLLEGLVDIYLPDLKYYDDELAVKYSNAFNYFVNAIKVIDEMYRQVGNYVIKDGIMKRGIIVRHMMLPKCLEDSKRIIKYLYDTYKDNIYISIMSQYTPIKKTRYSELNSKINFNDYDELVDYAYDLGIRNAFIQEEESCCDSFIPYFDGYGI